MDGRCVEESIKCYNYLGTWGAALDVVACSRIMPATRRTRMVALLYPVVEGLIILKERKNKH